MLNSRIGLLPKALFAAICFTATSAAALPVNVYSPHVEKGEAEIEYKGYRTFDDDAAKDDEQKDKLFFGYGFTDYLFVEVGGVWKQAPGGTKHVDAIEAEAVIQLTQPGEYWADFGLLLEYERVRDKSEADEAAIAALISKDWGNRTTTTANIIFERGVGSKASGAPEVEYAFAHRWRVQQNFEPGIEIYGKAGETNDLRPIAQQKIIGGPAVQGKIANIEGLPGKFGYDVGYMFGLTGSAPEGTLKAVLEYEFYF